MDTVDYLHSSLGGIGIYSAGQRFEKYINAGPLLKWTENENFRNLNFETNTQSALFSFYQKISEFIQANKHRFKFLKVK